MKTLWIALGSIALAGTLGPLLPAAAGQQRFGERDPKSDELPLEGRWVGPRDGRALWLEFFGDSMLVVNDHIPVGFELTDDSLIAWGDTSIVASYRLTQLTDGRGNVTQRYLLLYTDAGDVVTMTPQDPLARPMRGIWLPDIGFSEAANAELYMNNFGGARWRSGPGSEWIEGEWNRQSRHITFTWEPDSTVWMGFYDAEGNAILFDSTTVAGSSTVIFRRRYR